MQRKQGRIYHFFLILIAGDNLFDEIIKETAWKHDDVLDSVYFPWTVKMQRSQKTVFYWMYYEYILLCP